MEKCGIRKRRIERLELRVGTDKRILPRIIIIAGTNQDQVDRRIRRFEKMDKPLEDVEYKTLFIVPFFEKPKMAIQEIPPPLTIEESLTTKTDAELEKMLEELHKKAAEVRK